MNRADRAKLPALGPVPDFRFPSIRKQALSNGLGLWSIDQPALPVVTFMLVLPIGSAADPEGRDGLAALTGDMLDEGSGQRSAIDIHEAFARIGAQFDTEVTADATVLTVTALARFRTEALRLLADCVVRPRLDEQDFDRVRQLRLTRLVQLRDSPSAIADRAFMQLVYGSHPYGHLALGTQAGLQELSISEVAAFHRAAYVPSRATLVAAGDVNADELRDVAETVFGPWNGEASANFWGRTASVAEAPQAPAHPFALVHKAGAAQTELRIGHVGVPRDTPDYHALIVLNMVLGGQFVSRVNLKLRQEKGYTYGARTSFDFRRGPGPFLCQASVQSEATADAIGEAIAEMEAIRNERPPTPEEIDVARAALTRGYVRNFETPEQLARAMTQLVLYRLPGDYFDTFVPRVWQIEAEDARQAARKHLAPDRLLTAIVADGDTVRPQLIASGLGEPMLVTPKL